MFRNYIKNAIRRSFKDKFHTLLNILGLAIGMASALLILQYVKFETSYNDFHENRDEIYRISYSKEKAGVESFNTVLTYAGVGRLMVEQFPEVIDFVRLRPVGTIRSKTLIRYQDQFFEEEDVFFTEPSFFEIFSFDLVRGDASSVLQDQFTAVISESMAKKYFGNEDPIGKIIRKGTDENYMITGVMEDSPINSHVDISILLSHATLSAIMPDYWTDDNLSVFHGHLYIRTVPGTDPDALIEKFPQFVMDFVGGHELAKQDVVLKFAMMPLSDIHLHSHIEHEAKINGDSEIVLYLSIVGILIFIIALVNYINLATARAMERAKETGVRKVIGATQSSLLSQYMAEAFFINLFAIVLSLALVFLSQPFLAQLGASNLQDTDLFHQRWFWFSVLGIWIIASVLAGFYPAIVLSSYRPATVLSGKQANNAKGGLLRRGLVVFQFASSICMIIGTIIIYSQISYMRGQKLGMNIEDKLVLRGPIATDSTYQSNYMGLKNALLQMPAIRGVSSSQSIPGKEYNSATWFAVVDNPETDRKFCYINRFDNDFAVNFELEFLAGQNFSETDNTAILINKAAADLFEFQNPESAIGKRVTSGDPNDPESTKWKIIGVIDDFNQQSLKHDYAPVIIFRNENASNFYSVQFNSSITSLHELSNTIDQIRKHWFNSFSGNPFNYYFLREGFDQQYRKEIEFGRLLSIFSGLTILVAILGLIGLSSYTIRQRTKEIGIRKILGLNTPGIALLLSKDIFGPILLANLIAWPVCWYIFSTWVSGFSFRITMSIWPFLLAFLIILIIASLAMAYQITKASVSNPVRALRYE